MYIHINCERMEPIFDDVSCICDIWNWEGILTTQNMALKIQNKKLKYM
jgi:hypothetical protein